MGAFYHHTQTGAALRWGLILPAIGLLAIGFAARRAVPFVPLAALLAATGWAFSSLTVEVTPTRLIWFFGPGLLRKSIEREAIIGATPVRNPWWYGWGIHLHAARLALQCRRARRGRTRLEQWENVANRLRRGRGARKGAHVKVTPCARYCTTPPD